MIIELGGGDGPQYHPNYDARPFPQVDKVVDLADGLPFLPDSSVEGIFTSHTLEHLDRKQGLFLLKECFRVLMYRGWLKVIVPDMRYIVNAYQLEGKLTHRQYELLYGQQNHQYDYHKNVFDQSSLREALLAAGFETDKITSFTRNPDEVCLLAIKQFTLVIK